MPALNFDSNTVAPSTGFEPIPANWYRASIVASEIKPTRNGDGKYLALQWAILDGPYKERRVFSNLNIENKNAQTVQIAQADLSAICRATGVLTLKASEQLHDKPAMIRVVLKPGQDGEPRNEIKGYKAVDGAAVSAPTATAPTQNANASAVAPAWARPAKSA